MNIRGNASGKPVRLRFVMKDADLYSLRFRPPDGRETPGG